MSEPNHCPRCGALLPPGVLQNLCPACLLQEGVTVDSESQPSAPFVPPSLEEIARLFPQLELVALLGKGGMGAVYKARQTALDRLVALKILALPATPGRPFAERFTREARALARLSHPAIVGLYEFGEAGGLHYFIMEFVDGVNLRQLEKAGQLSPREALRIVPQICDALQYAHDEGVVHRDIKPENVLIDRKGRVKIADFGLAKILGLDAEALRLTGEGQVMGTPHYMAPEQVEHPLEVDHRADIYSLGVVFYEMLTGELPIGKFAPPSSRPRGLQIDVRLDQIVLRALEKAPDLRYQQASEVKTQVENLEKPSGPFLRAAPPLAVPQTGGPRLSRTALAGVIWAALFVVYVAVAFKLHWAGHPRWTMLLRFTLLPAGFTSPFGTIACGIVALQQIRHSAGRLYGRGLAWLDIFVFPVLVLAGFSAALVIPAIQAAQSRERLQIKVEDVSAHETPEKPRPGMDLPLAHGGKLRLIALTDPTDAGARWWAPDGTAITPDGDWERFRTNYRKEHLLAVIEAVHPGAQPPKAPVGPGGEEWAIPLYSAVPVRDPATGILAGFGAGPWHTCGLLRSGQSLKDGPTECALDAVKPMGADTSAAMIDLWFTVVPEMEVALLTVDRHGKQAPLGATYGLTSDLVARGTKWQLRQASSESAVDLDYILVQTRQRCWGRFSGFATKPGVTIPSGSLHAEEVSDPLAPGPVEKL